MSYCFYGNIAVLCDDCSEFYVAVLRDERSEFYVAGWSSLAARVAHNHEVLGSNPSPATRVN